MSTVLHLYLPSIFFCGNSLVSSLSVTFTFMFEVNFCNKCNFVRCKLLLHLHDVMLTYFRRGPKKGIWEEKWSLSWKKKRDSYRRFLSGTRRWVMWLLQEVSSMTDAGSEQYDCCRRWVVWLLQEVSSHITQEYFLGTSIYKNMYMYTKSCIKVVITQC